jgi:hypothetical protein
MNEQVNPFNQIQDVMNFINALSKTKKRSNANDSHWVIGKAYFIRTITHHYTGRLVKVTPKELVLEDAAWIPDDGRFADMFKNGAHSEVEPYPDNMQVIIGRGAILDAVQWTAKLPRDQK